MDPTEMTGSTTLKDKLALGALLLNVKRDLTRAAATFQKCIDEHPADFRAYFNLGTILDAPGEHQDYTHAAELFHKAITCDGTVIESYGCLSGVLLKLKRASEAATVCRDGLLVKPTDSPCLYNLNVALRQLSRISEAVDLSFHALQSSYSIDLKALVNAGDTSGSNIASTSSEVDRSSSSSSSSSGLIFLCVKWGTRYGPE
jgi:tetratricopeptide (TPR) repeat protein